MTIAMNIALLEEQFKPAYDDICSRLQELENAVYIRKLPADKTVPLIGKLVFECEQRPFASLLQLEVRGTTEICTRFAALYNAVFTDFWCGPGIDHQLELPEPRQE